MGTGSVETEAGWPSVRDTVVEDSCSESNIGLDI